MKPVFKAYLSIIGNWDELKKQEFSNPSIREAWLITIIDNLLDLLERALGL